ncbi:hypothetical protein NECAME_11082 [Necator americanus]|uniref:Uncharacterized protein n=1 Tax=Necator americanus TaxID=51031 RepID=W2T8U7_NECAM|nr:hypothetical protein NECAME_11082 [Necator americanus]ETN77412.1 hypothetical protein NECAME_11082 [Necator americanus]
MTWTRTETAFDVLGQEKETGKKNLKPSAPFLRINYNYAIRLYGNDKPDMRISWKIQDCTKLLG